MVSVLRHPANAGVIRSLCDAGRAPTVKLGSEVADPYYEAGAHPDIVERVWDELGRGLPPESRRLLRGTPVLVDVGTGLVLAVCMGTSYALRVPLDAVGQAVAAGSETVHRYGEGTVIDLHATFGPDWVFGGWLAQEPEWIRQAADAMRMRTSGEA